jgi:hypothetical protein
MLLVPKQDTEFTLDHSLYRCLFNIQKGAYGRIHIQLLHTNKYGGWIIDYLRTLY